jgi:hypothetical protein
MTENSTVDTNAAPDNVVTLTDLQNILVVMDLASSRGAFRGGELQPVGQLYDKISKFLQSVMPPAPAEGSEVAATEVASDSVTV